MSTDKLKLNIHTAIRVFTAVLLLTQSIYAQNIKDLKNESLKKPVLKVDVAFPTHDKPQSKLFYMDGFWWAVLPKTSGPSLWQRMESGWVEHQIEMEPLRGIPGRVDVSVDHNGVTGISVGKRTLVVFRLNKLQSGNEIKWNAEILTRLLLPKGNYQIETATLAQDTDKTWWVAADAGKEVFVWYSSGDQNNWSKPQLIRKGIHEDDICLVTAIPEGIAVVWSDQNKEGVYMRYHQNGDPLEKWSEVITIEEGNRTADDHLNAALSPDGTLWLTTKNSIDEVGRPQFVLRIRSPEGKWKNIPYENLQPDKLPSRPIIVTTEDPKRVVSAHSMYNSMNPYLGEMVFGVIDTTRSETLIKSGTPILPDTSSWKGVNRINDVTGPKHIFYYNIPWILLASDGDGNVYEMDAQKYFDNAK